MMLLRTGSDSRSKLARAAFGALFAFALLPGAASACDLTFANASGKTYDATQFKPFIEQEIRPRLSERAGTFQVTISVICTGQPAANAVITFDDTDYYITKIGDHTLTKIEYTYTNDPLSLDRADLEAEVQKAAGVEGLPLIDKQNLVKTLAFFFAETARFSDVEGAANSMISSGCSAHWLDYATLLRRWGRISKLALHEGTSTWTAAGGSSGQLIAPIAPDAIQAYNDAIVAGPDGPDEKYVDSRDWGSKVSVPTPTCAVH